MKDVRLIEIEINSYCNRKCEFCPNSIIDRTFKQRLPKEHIEENILKPLQSINYSNYISFSRYNEPVADKEYLVEIIYLVRQYLPKAKIVFNTNGDYNHDDIPYADITVMDYDKPLPFKPNDRGGILNKYSKILRTEPCLEPVHFIGVDYTGDVVPCCNIRGDSKHHEDYVLGNIKEKSIIDIYESHLAKAMRLITGNGEFPPVCRYCTKKPGRYTRDFPDKHGDMS